ncbi:MAG: hypothetical protein WBN39_10860, partial [Flavobacteriaceae bacterium]
DAEKNDFGVIIFIPFSTASLAIEQNINLWLTDIPVDWKETFNIGNNDLGTLLALLICKNWKGTIEAHVVNNNPELTFTDDDIEDLRTMVRFPKNTVINITQGDLLENTKKYRSTDINIFSANQGMHTAEMIDLVKASRISAIFCIDSQSENVLV